MPLSLNGYLAGAIASAELFKTKYLYKTEWEMEMQEIIDWCRAQGYKFYFSAQPCNDLSCDHGVTIKTDRDDIHFEDKNIGKALTAAWQWVQEQKRAKP